MPKNLCSFCQSPSIVQFNGSNSGQKKLPRNTSKGKSKSTRTTTLDCWLNWKHSCAQSFCSVFNLPADQFLPVLTNNSSTVYCRDCFSCLQELDFTLKQIEQLQNRLAWNKNQIEELLRFRFLHNHDDDQYHPDFVDAGSWDSGLLEMLRGHLPYLYSTVTVKIETDEPTVDLMDQENPHTILSEDAFDGLSGEEFAEECVTPSSSLECEQNSYSKSKNPRRRASARALKIVHEIIRNENVTVTSESDNKATRLTRKSVKIKTTENRVKSSNTQVGSSSKLEIPNKVGSESSDDDEESYAESDEQNDGAQDKVDANELNDIKRKKRILKLIEDHPTWKLGTIQKKTGASFKHMAYKYRWKRQIEEFEAKQSAAFSNDCARCLRGCKKFRVLRHHLTHFHPPRSNFICGICDQNIGSEEDLTNHDILHQVFIDTEFACLQCSKLLPDLESLKVHTWEHNLRQFKCMKPNCHKLFSNANYLAKHICRKIPKNQICELCGSAFSNKNKLGRHMLSHSNEKMFQCHICPASVKSKWSLSLHLKTQHGTKSSSDANASVVESNTLGPAPDQ